MSAPQKPGMTASAIWISAIALTALYLSILHTCDIHWQWMVGRENHGWNAISLLRDQITRVTSLAWLVLPSALWLFLGSRFKWTALCIIGLSILYTLCAGLLLEIVFDFRRMSK